MLSFSSVVTLNRHVLLHFDEKKKSPAWMVMFHKFDLLIFDLLHFKGKKTANSACGESNLTNLTSVCGLK